MPAGVSGTFRRCVPEGDDRDRLVCEDCGFVLYRNPKVVVGTVAAWEGRILLCRRAIEPGLGLWTLPAGYLELGESAEEGARREAREEARAEIAIRGVLAVYSVPRISQVQVIFAADLVSPEVAPGRESLEVGLFDWEAIPRGRIAFPSVHWALDHWREWRAAPRSFAARTNPPGERGDRHPLAQETPP